MTLCEFGALLGCASRLIAAVAAGSRPELDATEARVISIRARISARKAAAATPPDGPSDGLC